jgi:hypothetical protein
VRATCGWMDNGGREKEPNGAESKLWGGQFFHVRNSERAGVAPARLRLPLLSPLVLPADLQWASKTAAELRKRSRRMTSLSGTCRRLLLTRLPRKNRWSSGEWAAWEQRTSNRLVKRCMSTSVGRLFAREFESQQISTNLDPVRRRNASRSVGVVQRRRRSQKSPIRALFCASALRIFSCGMR